jgi:hypothetical protein
MLKFGASAVATVIVVAPTIVAADNVDDIVSETKTPSVPPAVGVPL